MFSSPLTPVFLALALVFSVAVLAKAAFAQSSGQPYRFGFWDGGLMLRDKEMPPIAGVLLGLVLLVVSGGGLAVLLFLG